MSTFPEFQSSTGIRVAVNANRVLYVQEVKDAAGQTVVEIVFDNGPDGDKQTIEVFDKFECVRGKLSDNDKNN